MRIITLFFSVILSNLALVGEVKEDYASKHALCVCEAVKIRSPKSISLRGTGVITKEGDIVLGDLTCPVAKTKAVRLPSLVLLEVGRFVSKQDEEGFISARKDRAGKVFQVLAAGDLKCQADLRVQLSDDGEDIVLGNGYGPDGLIKCKLEKSAILLFQKIE